jgi:ribosome-associated translation inhibitor RaiA
MSGDVALRCRATAAIRRALARLMVRPITAHVTFVDDNGPKGGRAAPCALTVRLPHRPHIRVEKVAETPRLAFDAALAVLRRDLEQYRERQRDQQRHPKKYCVAKRLREP